MVKSMRRILRIILRIFDYLNKIMRTNEAYAKYRGVKIGDSCSIATKSFGSEPYLIKIGNHVQITNGVRFFTHGGGWVFRDKYPNFDVFGKIIIGNNVYIGSCALIMPGVTVGNNVIIGAGSIVTKSIPDGKIVAGNPARIIGETATLEKRLIPFNVDSKLMSPDEKRAFLIALDEIKFLKK